MAVFYDTHAHLDFPDFQPDFAEVLARARAAGITRMICIGTNFESSRRAVALAEAHEELFAVAGWHPSDALQAPEDVRPMLRELARHPKVVAVGETGWIITACPVVAAARPQMTSSTNASRRRFSSNSSKWQRNWA